MARGDVSADPQPSRDGTAVTEPLVSVVLPVRNRQDVVAEALLSVLAQSYTNLEVIVVDDASTDGSLAEVERIADHRVAIVQNKGEHNASGARNTGIARASGRYLAFQDSDDWWHPDKITMQMSVLTDPAHSMLVAVGSNWRLMEIGGRRVDHGAPATYTLHSREAVLDGCLTGVVGTPMLLVDRERTMATPLFDPDFPSLEERDFVYRCLPAGQNTLAIMESVLVQVRRGRRDHVATPARSLVGYERFLTKYAAELASRPQATDWYHYRAMREALIVHERSRAAGHRAAMTNRPLRLALEYQLGRWFGYQGLAVATRAHLRPRIGPGCGA